MTKIRWFLLLSVVLLIAIIAAAVSMTLTRKPLRITVANARVPGGVLIHVAETQGFFEDEGLDAEVHTHILGRESIKELAADTADLAMAYDVVVLRHILDGERLRILSSLHSSAKANDIIARKSSGIATMHDLAGKIIALPRGTSADYFFSAAIALEGMNEADVTVIDTQPDELLAVLLNDEADAVAAWEPLSSEIERNIGEETVRLSADEYLEMSLLVGREEFVREHPEELKRFMQAINRAERFIEEHPEKADVVITDYLRSDTLNGRQYRDVYEWHQRINNLLVYSLQDEVSWLAGPETAALPDIRMMIETDYLRDVHPQAVTIN